MTATVAFTRNGYDEPNQPIAVIGWGGPLRYRAGPFDVTWSDAGGTFTANESLIRRVFRSDLLTPEGLYTELSEAADVASCAAAVSRYLDKLPDDAYGRVRDRNDPRGRTVGSVFVVDL